MNKFYENNKENIERLKQYVPIVSRVHGTLHPEMKDVLKVFNELINKINQNDLGLTKHFSDLRLITNNYQIPTNVCESYEAVYKMLEEVDNNFNKQS